MGCSASYFLMDCWRHSSRLRRCRRYRFPPRLMELERAAAYVGFGRTKFQDLETAGLMPKPVDVDGSPRWDRLDLDRAVDDLKDKREAKPRSVIDEQLERMARGDHEDQVGLQRSKSKSRRP
jgi:hypothetical protein